MAYQLANSFGHPLFGSFAMKENVFFGFYGGEGKPMEDGSGDDVLGELREEEIVWGEVETHHQYKEANIGGERSTGKFNSGDRRVMGHRSMLSRQMEMQGGAANTWASGGGMSAVQTAKNGSNKGGLRVKGAGAQLQSEGYEVEGGSGGEEGGGMQQHMDELIPPHELLARQYAATATSSSSVLQGAGRTLKGMDLRRLRNEVWRQTGFVD
eukprot:c18707_g2_i1 orf=462-1094(+)